MKSPEISPPRKYPIPNQDSTRIITQQDTNLPPHLTKVLTGRKTFIDDTRFSDPTENENTGSTDNTRTDTKYYVNKINVDKDEDNDDEYKEDNLEAPKSDESVINKNKIKEALTDRLMSTNVF